MMTCPKCGVDHLFLSDRKVCICGNILHAYQDKDGLLKWEWEDDGN